MNTEALPHTPIGGQSTLPTPTVSQSAKIIDKNEDRKCFFPFAIWTLIYFLKLTCENGGISQKSINRFPARRQMYFCQTFLWFSWKSIQCFHVTLIVAEGLEVIYWICSVWTKHFSVGSSANSASQKFPSSSRQRQKFWRPFCSSVDGAGGVKKGSKISDNTKTSKCQWFAKKIFCLQPTWLEW